MNIFEKHELFEIEVLEKLKNSKLLEPLVFGGGTMLRLCYELKRYSVDLDFWFIRKIAVQNYFKKCIRVLEQEYEITDAQKKYYTLLFEIRSGVYPKRLKIEIRKEIKDYDFVERIAYSKYSNKQVILRTHTLEQTIKNKIAALLDRNEIRDGFDIEFLLRKGIRLPELKTKQLSMLKERVTGFKEKDFKVTLGSVLESDIRKYYIENRFHYLLEKIAL
ncbi:MAG: nucleotidyl transferase AbiEii/AbiGii toxin family protein [Planctomycetota bacterium]|jgi:predicted nucleotidyltransferase component of viral defense system